VEPDPDPPGSEIICFSGSENNIGSRSGSGTKLIVKINMCPSLELTLQYKFIIPLLNCLIFISIQLVKNEFLEWYRNFFSQSKKKVKFKNNPDPEPDPELKINVKSEPAPHRKKSFLVHNTGIYCSRYLHIVKTKSKSLFTILFK
jgi:hypothetical protein